jgi:PAS domain S-box-containing protein
VLWLCLLGAATVLTIAVRRGWRRATPLDDEVYLNNVAVENLQSGVAWVGVDGNIGFVNQAFATALGVSPADIVGRNWYGVFTGHDRFRIEEVYRQMQAAGLASFEVTGSRGSKAPLDLLLVAVYDEKKHFRGHHCILADRVRERELEERLRELTEASEHASPQDPEAPAPAELSA